MTYEVLIVDDDPVVSTLIAALVARAGWNPVTMADGASALAHLAHQPCDLVISDIKMPGMSGLELRDRIRADARLARLPIVLLTATVDSVSAEANHDERTLVIAKPVRPGSFAGDVRNWMQTSR